MIGRFALAWDEFQAKMAERFKTLLHGGEFSDVTLVAKDSTCLKVHKVILASGSGFFKDIMSQMDNHPNALIYMIGMDLEVLQAILEFLYIGEVEVKQEIIENFMKAATELKIDGLHTKEAEVGDKVVKSAPITTEAETQFNVRLGGGVKANSMTDMFNIKKRSTKEVMPEAKVKPTLEPIQQFDTKDTPLSDLQYPCDFCEFVTDRKRDLRYHMGEKHRREQESIKINSLKKGIDGLYWCSMCEKSFGDPSNLRRHIKKVHLKILHFCTDCNYSSTGQAYVKDHHNNVHLGMMFPCSQCGHQAKSPTLLRMHEKSVHDCSI